MTPAASRKAWTFPLRYLAVAFAFTWAFWWPAALEERGLVSLPVPAVFLGAFGPTVAAVAVVAWDSGRVGLRSLLGRVVRWRVAPIWYGVILLGPLVFQALAVALHVALGGRTPHPVALLGTLPVVLALSAYYLVFVALPEEVGWRGYALPALQGRHGALPSAVVVGAAWPCGTCRCSSTRPRCTAIFLSCSSWPGSSRSRSCSPGSSTPRAGAC